MYIIVRRLWEKENWISLNGKGELMIFSKVDDEVALFNVRKLLMCTKRTNVAVLDPSQYWTIVKLINYLLEEPYCTKWRVFGGIVLSFILHRVYCTMNKLDRSKVHFYFFYMIKIRVFILDYLLNYLNFLPCGYTA